MKLINVHMNTSSDIGERFDTLTSPAGSIATLLDIESHLGQSDIIGIDEAYPGRKQVREMIHRQIVESERISQVALLFSVLIYNAEPTLKLISELKSKYGDRIKIIVGGQLIPFAKQAYLNNQNIDAVCVGDAEVVLPVLLRDIENDTLKREYTGWLKDTDLKVFSGMSYDHFYGISERLLEQKRRTGFSQLLTQGVGGPGCSWAANNPVGACNFCALQNITTMNELTLQRQFEREYELQSKFHPDRLFDVANQFFPFLNQDQVKNWLKEYVKIRNETGVTVSKYCYLTVSSINEEIASLLKQAGITEVYLGIDHFDPTSLKAENKSFRSQSTLKRCLDALKNNGIAFRTGVVIGAVNETEESLRSIKEGISWLRSEYSSYLQAIGIYPIEIIPGSKIFNEMQSSGIEESIFNFFQNHGYLTRDHQHQLTYAYIAANSTSGVEDVLSLASELASREVSYTVDASPSAEFQRKNKL